MSTGACHGDEARQYRVTYEHSVTEPSQELRVNLKGAVHGKLHHPCKRGALRKHVCSQDKTPAPRGLDVTG